MKKRHYVILFMAMLLVAGCAMQKHRRYIREGLFVSGLNREAFLAEWGNPDETYTTSGEEVAKLDVKLSGFKKGATFLKGKPLLDVWVYKGRDAVLVFEGLRLVSWKIKDTN